MRTLITVSTYTCSGTDEACCRILPPTALALALACLVLPALSQAQRLVSPAPAEPEDLISTARKLATTGQRAEALQMLDQRLAEKRRDTTRACCAA